MNAIEFQAIGQTLFAGGLVCNQSGNLSVRDGQRLCITRRGCTLHCLAENDLVRTGIAFDDELTPMASSELAVHRAIYKKTQAVAIVHAHPVHTIALSFVAGEISPCDMEGQIILGKVPVVGHDRLNIKPGAMAEEIADALIDNKIVAIRGHGSFATGKSLQEALEYTTTLEHCCHILYLVKTMGDTPA